MNPWWLVLVGQYAVLAGWLAAVGLVGAARRRADRRLAAHAEQALAVVGAHGAGSVCRCEDCENEPAADADLAAARRDVREALDCVLADPAVTARRLEGIARRAPDLAGLPARLADLYVEGSR